MNKNKFGFGVAAAVFMVAMQIVFVGGSILQTKAQTADTGTDSVAADAPPADSALSSGLTPNVDNSSLQAPTDSSESVTAPATDAPAPSMDTSATPDTTSATTDTTQLAPVTVTTPSVTPTLTTDKADYHPAETVSILGRFFSALQNIVLKIFGSPINNTSEIYTEDTVNVASDSNGSFDYNYALSDLFIPLYRVVANDSTGNFLAETSFTDSIQTDFSQCSNKNPTLGNCNWIGSVLQSHNSQYFEGMTVPQRVLFRDAKIVDGTHHITFTYEYTKGGIHAYDFLTTVRPDTLTVQGNTPPETLNPCADLGGADTTACNLLSPGTTPPKAQITVLNDPFDSKDSAPFPGIGSTQTTKEQAYETANGVLGSRKITVYATTASAFGGSPSVTLTHVPATANSDTGDSAVAVDIAFTSNGCNTGNGCNYLLYFGGHLAVTGANNNTGSNWGPGLGSSQINGGPYHIKDLQFDGTGGSQDNQIQGADIILPPEQTATLTAIKHVVNDNGGTATASNFTMNVTGTNVQPSASFPGAELSGTTVTLDAGSYSVGESSVAGYTGSSSADCTGTINAGEAKTCTITNDDNAPALTLVKAVTNNNGGTAQPSAWTLTATGPTGFSGAGPSVSNGASFDAGTYALSESGGPSGYSASAWVCVGGGTQIGSNITLGLGQSATCTITNDDQSGTLHVVKVVTNDNGGSLAADDFSFAVNGGQAVAFNANGQNDITVNAGTYSVTEPAVSGYATSYNNCSQVQIPNGGEATCTVTNDDQPAHLILVKHLPNDNGGTATQDNFPVKIDNVAAV